MGIVEKLVFPSLLVPALLQVGIWDWFGFVLGFFFCAKPSSSTVV